MGIFPSKPECTHCKTNHTDLAKCKTDLADCNTMCDKHLRVVQLAVHDLIEHAGDTYDGKVFLNKYYLGRKSHYNNEAFKDVKTPTTAGRRRTRRLRRLH